MRKKNIIRLTTAILFALAAVFAGDPARAQSCEYPLFIQEGAVDANVLFLFDNSGSMNEIIFHNDFNPNVTYTGGLSTNTMYYVSSPGSYGPNKFRTGLGSTPKALFVTSDNGQNGRYLGNYLNWLFYHATLAQRSSIPLVTRVQVAKAAVNDIVAGTENLRFGVMRFNYESGGTLAAPVGTPVADILTYVNAITADTWTPLAETMVNILDYYKLTGSGAPIQYACQKNFVVCVTDGYPTKDRNIPSYIGDYDHDGLDPGTCVSIGCTSCGSTDDCTHYLDDVALYLRVNDLRSDLDGVQNVFTYMVGFGIDAPLLAETAREGGGFYTTANNASELQNSLENIMRDIANRISSGSAVAVVSTEGQDADLLYRGKFLPGVWRGFLEAFELPYEPGEEPLWEAGAILSARDPSSRNLFTSVGGAAIDFGVDNAATLTTELGVATTTEAENLINWVSGQNVAGFRDRGGWVFGDVVDSSPLVVGPPSSFHLENDYLAFRDAMQSRPRMVYIGANDGMLHAFRAEDGYESWAYIPNNCLGDLSTLADSAYCHQFFVNLTPAAVDAYVNGSWRTILMGGQKHGGGAYFAIDVTYPESPELMWEIVLPTVAESWAKPEVYRSASDGYVVVFGTGPDFTTGEAHVIGVDISTGAEVWSQLLSTSGSGMNMATAATTVDLEFDGYEDLLYIADLAGNLWRFDLADSPPSKSLLFQTDGQPVQAQPILTVDYNNDVFLYFGTGRYVEASDIADASLQTFYSIIDNHSETQVSRSDLVDETYEITELTADDRGWYIDLVQASGERITEPDALVAEIVYFTSFAPADVPCGAGGYSWLYKVKFRSGAGEDDDEDDSNDGIEGRVEELGEGVATKPVIDIANENVIVQGSDTRIHVRDTANSLRQLIVRSWRQLYN